MLVVFSPARQQAYCFSPVSTVAFGILTYMIVGGTRANITIAFCHLLFIGIIRGWIRCGCWLRQACLALSGLFWLALEALRGMNVAGDGGVLHVPST